MPGFNICSEGAADAPIGTIATARKYRWKLKIYSSYDSVSSFRKDGGDITIYAHKAQRPAIEIDTATFHHSQDEIYMPGKQRWLPIEISFYEIIGGSGGVTASYFYEWWSGNVIDIQNSQIKEFDGTGIKKTCELIMLNSVGSDIYRYILLGCWPEKITPDELDYSSNDIAEITVKLRIDKVEEEAVSAGRVALFR